MGTRTIAVLVTIAFSVIGVLGDYFLKLASAREQPLRTGWFYLGFALYASTAFGWVFVMKHLKLATISVLYSVSLVLLLTAIGVVLSHEQSKVRPTNAWLDLIPWQRRSSSGAKNAFSLRRQGV